LVSAIVFASKLFQEPFQMPAAPLLQKGDAYAVHHDGLSRHAAPDSVLDDLSLCPHPANGVLERVGVACAEQQRDFPPQGPIELG
jgi:hypothetical protein